MNKIFLLLCCLLLLSACQNGTISYRQVRAVHNPSEPTSTETPQPGTETQPLPAAASLKDQLKDYLQNPPTSKISYNLRTVINDKNQTQTITGIQQVIVRGKDMKLQTETSMEGNTFVTANYLVNGQYYACQQEKQWTCYSFPKPPEDQVQQAQQTLKEDLDKLDIRDGGQRVLLNTPTQCFVLDFEDPQSREKGQTTYCYTENGALLYSQTKTPDFENTLEATSSSSTITENDFTLPATPQPIESLDQSSQG